MPVPEKTFLEVLEEELVRNRELLKLYESIPTGVFGAAMLRKDIKDTENAIRTENLAAMVSCLKRLRENE